MNEAIAQKQQRSIEETFKAFSETVRVPLTQADGTVFGENIDLMALVAVLSQFLEYVPDGWGADLQRWVDDVPPHFHRETYEGFYILWGSFEHAGKNYIKGDSITLNPGQLHGPKLLTPEVIGISIKPSKVAGDVTFQPAS